MKLLNPNEPLSEDKTETKTKSSPKEPLGETLKQVVRRAHPISSLPPEAATLPEERTEPSSAPPTERRSQGPVRSSGQGATLRARSSGLPTNPGARLRAVEEAGKTAKPLKLPLRYRLQPDRRKTRYAFWDVAAVLSLAINAVLLALLVIMALQIRTLRETVGKGLLGGLYSSFVDMDHASITSTINVQTQLPLSFNLPVQQNTNVTLTKDVAIPGAHVTINSALINISAPANVTLPAGTSLPIALNMQIPVQVTIPISLQVPVNIPLAGTGLHGPFIGLQAALRPYYCLLEPNAQYPQGMFICQELNNPHTTTGVP